MRLNRLKIIILASLAGLNLAAALFAWRSFAGAEPGERIPARSAAMIVPAGVSDAPAIPEGDDRETLSRPLFVKSRRPSQNASRAASEASVAPPPAGLQLHAVVGFSHSARAFVTSSSAADGKWLKVGENFENWMVDSIAAQEIALRQDADLLRVGLFYDTAAAPVGLTPTPPPPPPKTGNSEEAPAKVIVPDAFAPVRDSKRGGH
jgi:hypothetical protein